LRSWAVEGENGHRREWRPKGREVKVAGRPITVEEFLEIFGEDDDVELGGDGARGTFWARRP